jgi:lipopolysaccharide/colanic/teichoic acid biosynthesis glycosyltransferase
MQRVCDFFLSLFGLIFTFPILIILILISAIETGSPLFIQVRVGKNKKPFKLIKLRSMKLNTVSVATHLVDASAVTTYGHFLRRTKLDELPQLWNVLKGEMSLVGPRPCLFNQTELITEREKMGVFNVHPGITGLAQIQGIDMSTPILLAKTDALMIQNMNFKNYFQYLLKTVSGAGSGDRITK